MKWLQSIIYGFVSGISELLPISSSAHQKLLLKLFGVDRGDPILNLLVHIAILVAVYFNCKNLIQQTGFNLPGQAASRRRHSGQNFDRRFVKSASIAFCIVTVLVTYIFKGNYSLANVAVFSLINGIVLFVSGRALMGNKNAKSMSALDSAATGVLGALSVLPGISRTAMTLSVPGFRGADRENALNWTLLISIPALAVMILMDFVDMFAGVPGMPFVTYLGYLLAAGAAYVGAYCAIYVLRLLTARTGYSGFAFYSWGVSLFSFILYLI